MLESDKLSLKPQEEPEENLADIGVAETEKKPDFAEVQEAVKEQASAIRRELNEKKPFFSPKTAEILGTALVSMQLLLTGCSGEKSAVVEAKPAAADVDQETIDKLKKQLEADFDKKWKEKEAERSSIGPKAATPASPVAPAPKAEIKEPPVDSAPAPAVEPPKTGKGGSILETLGKFAELVVDKAEKEKIEREKKDKLPVGNLQEWTDAEKIEIVNKDNILVTINGQIYIVTQAVLELLEKTREQDKLENESKIEDIHKYFSEMEGRVRGGIFRSAFKKKEDIKKNEAREIEKVERSEIKKMRQIIKNKCEVFFNGKN